jgi:signal transduction histidine kinase
MTQQIAQREQTLSRALRQKAQALELEIRERKRMEDALQEAERRRDEFLATLAHELRNPLAPIRNAAEIMKVADSDPARMAAARALIERQIAHLVRLIDDLLDVSRITRGRFELRTHDIDLVSAVDAAIEITRPVIDRKRHDLHVRVTGPAIVNGDLTRLAQVVSTLIDNSATYSDPGSSIEVSLAPEGAEAVIRVRDQGIGIAPELLPWVFDMFARPSPAYVGARSGLGIGLTLVKRLVELHGGNVEAHSEGRNRGSTFAVRLPLARGVTESVSDSSRSACRSELEPMSNGRPFTAVVTHTS